MHDFELGEDVYAVMDDLGRTLFVTRDFDEACDAAARVSDGHWGLLAPTPDELAQEDHEAASATLRRAANPRKAPEFPSLTPHAVSQEPLIPAAIKGHERTAYTAPWIALREGNLRPVSFEDVRNTTTADAYAEVKPLLEEHREARRRLERLRPYDAINVGRRLRLPIPAKIGKGKKAKQILAAVTRQIEALLGGPDARKRHNEIFAAIREDIRTRVDGVNVVSLGDLLKPQGTILTENAKLSKSTKFQGRPTVALGLAMLPEATAFEGQTYGYREAARRLGSAKALVAGANAGDPDALARLDILQRSGSDASNPIVEDWSHVPQIVANQLKKTSDAAVHDYMARLALPTGRTIVEGVGPTPHKGKNLCAMASAECKKTCLVFSGQNQADAQNNFVKMIRARMFLEHPVAFMRLLAEAIRKFAAAGGDNYGTPGSTARFVRLNVFQDIPWELVAPWIFQITDDLPVKQRIRFYDYTKIPGRPHTENYHLSFSYSGTKVNRHHCNSEFARGRNIVVVFGALGYIAPSHAARKKLPIPKEKRNVAWNRLPASFMDVDMFGGRELLLEDGDKSDIRPLDRPGRIVGLRWKPPMLGGYSREVAEQYLNAFVVKGRVVAGRDPKSHRGRKYLIFGNTPMSQPITQEGADLDRWVEWSK